MLPDDPELYALFGWVALFDGLRLINERDPQRRLAQIPSEALAEFVGHRRDALLHHHFPQFAA